MQARPVARYRARGERGGNPVFRCIAMEGSGVTAILILVPVVLVLGGIFAGLFLYAARSGQFDDLDDPPERILHD